MMFSQLLNRPCSLSSCAPKILYSSGLPRGVSLMSCRELEAAEAEVEAKKREERRRQERKNRDAFTALLRRHAAEGLITARMHFKVRQVGCLHLPLLPNAAHGPSASHYLVATFWCLECSDSTVHRRK